MLQIADCSFQSRVVVGTGNHADRGVLQACLEASGTALVTFAVRAIDLDAPSGAGMLDSIDTDRVALLPGTEGCTTPEDAVRAAHLGREALGTRWVRLVVVGDPQSRFPDVEGTLEAARQLVKDDFVVLAGCLDDPVACRRLADLGCAAVMPLAAPVGSGLGIQNPHNLRIIAESVAVPVIVEACGTASDVALALELGLDGVLVDAAITGASDPVKMAEAIRYAALAGRAAFEAGRMPRKPYPSVGPSITKSSGS